MENINTEKLVNDIKSGEDAWKGSSWDIWCKKRGLGTEYSFGYYPADYSEHMTKLYTLRAWLRGRIHRKNPPAPIRDYNRSMEENGSSSRMSWDMESHNQMVAESISTLYDMEEAA